MLSQGTTLTPARNALHCQVGLASGRSLGGDWRRRPGRPRARWTDQLRNDTGSVPANLWRHGAPWSHGGATRRPQLATRWWRRRRKIQIWGSLRYYAYRKMTVAKMVLVRFFGGEQSTNLGAPPPWLRAYRFQGVRRRVGVSSLQSVTDTDLSAVCFNLSSPISLAPRTSAACY